MCVCVCSASLLVYPVYPITMKRGFTSFHENRQGWNWNYNELVVELLSKYHHFDDTMYIWFGVPLPLPPPPPVVWWWCGTVWMVGMVCKSVGYGMFDMTVCMVCMVCLVTMMGMECLLCKVGMVCMACMFGIVCVGGVAIMFHMYGINGQSSYGMYGMYGRYGMHGMCGMCGMYGIIGMYGRYGIS